MQELQFVGLVIHFDSTEGHLHIRTKHYNEQNSVINGKYKEGRGR